jgi:hypothetical protein
MKRTRDEASTWSRRKLPKSCIESTCHAIQRHDGWTTWKSSATTTSGPGVWVAFGNKMICVSRVSNLADLLTGVTDFDPNLLGASSFPAILKTGRGIMIANSKKSDEHFNMHLGAVIGTPSGKFTITDMSEDGPVINSTIETQTIKSTKIIDKFRGTDYGDVSVYKVGLLFRQDDTAYATLSGKFGKSATHDEK